MYGTTSLLMASKGGYQQIVEMLLRHGADTEVAGRAYGTTSLVAAAQHGHAQVVLTLLEYGAVPDKTLNDGSSALSKARLAPSIAHGPERRPHPLATLLTTRADDPLIPTWPGARSRAPRRRADPARGQVPATQAGADHRVAGAARQTGLGPAGGGRGGG